MAPQALGKSRGERRLAATARATALGGAVRAAARVIHGTPGQRDSCNATRQKTDSRNGRPSPVHATGDAKMTHKDPHKINGLARVEN
jgi:hypothetical protein